VSALTSFVAIAWVVFFLYWMVSAAGVNWSSQGRPAPGVGFNSSKDRLYDGAARVPQILSGKFRALSCEGLSRVSEVGWLGRAKTAVPALELRPVCWTGSSGTDASSDVFERVRVSIPGEDV
jgi:hypothetical protein